MDIGGLKRKKDLGKGGFEHFKGRKKERKDVNLKMVTEGIRL